jgi:hypothetical protein
MTLNSSDNLSARHCSDSQCNAYNCFGVSHLSLFMKSTLAILLTNQFDFIQKDQLFKQLVFSNYA